MAEKGWLGNTTYAIRDTAEEQSTQRKAKALTQSTQRQTGGHRERTERSAARKFASRAATQWEVAGITAAAGNAVLWSRTMRQPSGNFLKFREKTPEGWSTSRTRWNSPTAYAASGQMR